MLARGCFATLGFISCKTKPTDPEKWCTLLRTSFPEDNFGKAMAISLPGT